MDLNRPFEITQFIRQAIEASAYAAPDDHGLSLEELCALGTQLGFGRGEVSDTLQASQVEWRYLKGKYLLPADRFRADFVSEWLEPDPRNVHAFEFVVQELRAIARDQGLAGAQIDRNVLIARGEQAGYPSNDLRVALLMLGLDGLLKDGPVVLLTEQGNRWNPPLRQYEQRRRDGRANERKYLQQLLPLVRDAIARRSDGRPSVADPLQAFGERLEKLGNAGFKVWWEQLRGEQQTANPRTNAVTVCVMSAALVEGALALVVAEARKRGDSMTRSTPPEDKPRAWKLADLIAAARSGNNPIFDQKLAGRCDRLNVHRQRIHAGALLDPGKAYNNYDARPDEAAEARETANAAARRILEWLDTPPGT